MPERLLSFAAEAAAFYGLSGLAALLGFRLGITRAAAARFRPSAWLALFLLWPLVVIRGAVGLVDSWRAGGRR